MLRIASVTLPNEKRIEISLTYIYGVGLSTSKKLLKSLNIDPNIRTKDLSDEDGNKLRDYIDKNHKVEGQLRQVVLLNIKRKKEIGSYQGIRHIKNLPVRGQRTKTNSRTRHGNVRKTAGSGKKKSSDKT
jgi:small subunit ribosomal protein S13